jgi:hypothetical protein
MRKWLILGLIIFLSLPAGAWGQDAGEKFVGSKIKPEEMKVAPKPTPDKSEKYVITPSPFPDGYPPMGYPPRPTIPPMTDQMKLYQARLDQDRQQEQIDDEQRRKKTIEEQVQERELSPKAPESAGKREVERKVEFGR